MTVLERIKKISKKRGYSLTQVNEKAHLGTNTIYSWKTKEPSFNNLQAVAKVLDVSVDYLLGKTDIETTKKKHVIWKSKKRLTPCVVTKVNQLLMKSAK
ncbi:DNA-binding helix-turn-helix protein [Pediococcus acidilactici 7_4]|uniref:helix-turn-helix domain-containing protein n=1 Tax=Pediococcus acidilactici TaxID=1254 RepID=UPI0001BEDECC|nr:helix-turn-helix transcriptional regulator [Pediococcus acidilactici]EFA25740.1 DNA-binding helix-turn-helix protein [Pediococcus acidilactici 7_4]